MNGRSTQNEAAISPPMKSTISTTRVRSCRCISAMISSPLPWFIESEVFSHRKLDARAVGARYALAPQPAAQHELHAPGVPQADRAFQLGHRAGLAVLHPVDHRLHGELQRVDLTPDIAQRELELRVVDVLALLVARHGDDLLDLRRERNLVLVVADRVERVERLGCQHDLVLALSELL